MADYGDLIGRRGVPYRQDVSAKQLTTFRSGGNVAYLACPRSEEEIAYVLRTAKERRLPCRVIGGGSNVLLPDRGFDGVLIRLVSWDRIEVSGREMTVGAGVPMPRLARVAAQSGLSGAEFACGIPGTAGGAAAVGAGAFGESMSELIEEITALDPEGRVEKLDPAELGYGYHRAVLPPGRVILSLRLRLTESDCGSVTSAMRSMRERRLATQPHQPSAGSVFRRVGDTPAAIYIERTGLKGIAVGGALLSERHCNFIVNAGGATTEEYFALAEKVRERVLALCGVTLEYEVERICSRIGN